MTVADLFGLAILPELRKQSRFVEFWRAYPRRVDKRYAETCYHKAIERGAAESDILAGAMRYAAKVVGDRTEERFIKHPSTWLNRDGWKDEPSRSPSRSPSFMDIVRG